MNLRCAFSSHRWVDCKCARCGKARPLIAEAMMSGDWSSVRSLLKEGADVNAKEAEGWTALHRAMHKRSRGGDSEDITTLLLSNGADVNSTNRIAETPLHLAAEFGRRQAAALLLAKAAEVDARDKDGKTPLFKAATTKAVYEGQHRSQREVEIGRAHV